MRVTQLLKQNPYQIYQNSKIDENTVLDIFTWMYDNCATKTKFFKKELMTKKNLNPVWLDFLVKQQDFKKVDELYFYQYAQPESVALIQELIPECVISHQSALIENELSNDFHENPFITIPDNLKINKKVFKLFPYLNVYKQPQGIFKLGKVKKQIWLGEEINIYNKEKTICDIVFNKKDIDFETYNRAIGWYFTDKKNNFPLLLKYAKKMNIEKQIKELINHYEKR